MRSAKTRNIGDIINEVIEDFGIKKKLDQSKAISLWQETVGGKLSLVTSPLYIKGGKLFVKVSTFAWQAELIFLKRGIIKRLNEKIGGNVVKDIIFLNRVGD